MFLKTMSYIQASEPPSMRHFETTDLKKTHWVTYFGHLLRACTITVRTGSCQESLLTVRRLQTNSKCLCSPSLVELNS